MLLIPYSNVVFNPDISSTPVCNVCYTMTMNTARLIFTICASLITMVSGSGKVLRLAGGKWDGEGRVEIFHNGAWGTVCDDKWGIEDAQVVCRQLGYPKALNAIPNAWFGRGNGNIWMDNVECKGQESAIENCQHVGWGNHNCNDEHGEDASVICSKFEVLGHWILDGWDQDIKFNRSMSFTEGRCPGSKAPIFNQLNPFVTAPIINLNGKSFTISCWIKQTKWVHDQNGTIYGDWHDPWQFRLSTRNQRIVFTRHKNGSEEWWSVQSMDVSLSNWTHVAVTWDHVTGTVLIYADGKEIGNRTYYSGETFYGPTGKHYMIGNDGDKDNQFHGSVMDLYVFAGIFLPDEIDTLRVVPVIVNVARIVAGGTVVVKWDGLACPVSRYNVYYREVVLRSSENKWNSVIVNSNATSHTLYLDCFKEYQVAVTSLNAHRESDLNQSRVWNFQTGGEDNCCVEVNWQITLNQPGWATYSGIERYLNGVWRNSNGHIDHIAKGRYCTSPHEYHGETPICQIVDWKTSLSRNHNWASCPNGYFLKGFYYSNDTWSIERAKCCRPGNFKDVPLDCNDMEISLQNQVWRKCEDWSYLAGLYREECDSLACITKFRCCRMPPPEMVVLGHWRLDGRDEEISFHGSQFFVEGRCPGSKAPIFNQSDSFATAPIITLNGRSFTISCWIKQTTNPNPEVIETIYSDWHRPWQFFLFTKNQKINFQRHSHLATRWWNIESIELSLSTWTHVAVTWDHVSGIVLIYANGKKVANKEYNPSDYSFYIPTGKPYKISNDGHKTNHQFHGAVMDLYVFGTALSLDEIDKLRGVPLIVNKVKEVAGGTTVVRWEPPMDGSCPVVKFNVYYREVISSAVTGNWSSVTVDGNATNHTLHLNCWKEYEIAVSRNLHKESDFSDRWIWNFKTGKGVPVIKNKAKEVAGGTFVVRWEPHEPLACPVVGYNVFYRQVISSAGESNWTSVTVNANATNHTLHLSCRKEYELAVTSINALRELELNDSRIWNFKTRGEKPSPPTINNKETETFSCGVNLTWDAPPDNGCPLTMYSVYYRVQETETPWHEVNVTEVMETRYALSLRCDTWYTIEMSAWNELGQSDRSRSWTRKINSDKLPGPSPTPKSDKNGSLSAPQYAGLVAGIVVLLIAILLVIFWLRRRAQIKKQLAQSRRSKSTIIPLLRWEVLPEQVEFKEEIGRGAFGKVFRGIFRESPGIEVFYKCRTQTVDFKEGRTVAVKVLEDKTDEEAREQFLEEIEIMKSIGCHKNVLSMLGCWVNSNPIFLLLEYVPYGDLQHWLRNKRKKSYLSSNGFVHRDLAARNILLGEDRSVKISDFGLMRHIRQDVYKIKKGKKIPYKWMAPEAIYESEYTTKSDVWSFGVLLWELCTMGGNPYPGINNKELYMLLKTGYRMEKPDTCSDQLYQLVLECWKEDPSERPTFDQAAKTLGKMMTVGTPYIDFDLLDESKAYYNENIFEGEATENVA